MTIPELRWSSANGSHPCETANCTAVVPYDDEPHCFTHSPDSGSMVPGYSYKATVPVLA